MFDELRARFNRFIRRVRHWLKLRDETEDNRVLYSLWDSEEEINKKNN
jgi:hypothetical protein